MRDFLNISMDRTKTLEFVESTTLAFGLRFLKSENLEKRLKGISEIRLMIERAIERRRFDMWR